MRLKSEREGAGMAGERRIKYAENCCRALRAYLAGGNPGADGYDPEAFHIAVDWCIKWLSVADKRTAYIKPPRPRMPKLVAKSTRKAGA